MNETWIKEMARKLVQKPRDPNNPGLTEAKHYVMFVDAVAALTEAYEAGEIAMKEKAAEYCKAYAELLRPEDRAALRLIGAQIGGLAISVAEESKKEQP